jgi:predicted Zn-ribbon and HTH transcriptional regulator
MTAKPPEPQSLILHCLRCGHKWMRRTMDRPAQCPRCKQPRWDTPSSRPAKESK